MEENVYLFILVSMVRLKHPDIDQEVVMEFDYGIRYHYAVATNVHDVYQYLLSLNIPFAFDITYEDNGDNEFSFREMELRYIDNEYQLIPFNEGIALTDFCEYETEQIKLYQVMNNI